MKWGPIRPEAACTSTSNSTSRTADFLGADGRVLPDVPVGMRLQARQLQGDLFEVLVRNPRRQVFDHTRTHRDDDSTGDLREPA
jgi:hypothetical protein